MIYRIKLSLNVLLFSITTITITSGQQVAGTEALFRENRSPDIVVDYVKTAHGVSIHRDLHGRYRSIGQLPENVRDQGTISSVRHEVRAVNSTMTAFVVSDASDAPDSDINDGVYSPPTLRSAIENANKLGGSHSIIFSPSVTLIQPLTSLPSINVAVTIDGSIAGGKVIVDGSLTTGGYGLLTFKPITVKNMIFRFWKSVGLGLGFGANNSVIQKNEFTQNTTGLNINSNDNLIGGDDPADRNFAYGNTQDGIVILYGNDNIVKNNFCGTKDGLTASPNTSAGMYVLGERTQVMNNVISGNSDAGLEIGEFSKNTLVRDNLIGLDSAGNGKLPNTTDGISTFADNDSIIFNTISGNGYGISVLGQASQTHMRGNIIGPNKSLDSLHGNRYGGLYVIGADATIDSIIISANKGAGITLTGFGGAVVKRNHIGTDPSGTLDWGNTGPGMNIYSDRNIIGGDDPSNRNIISGNGGGGIEMFGGITFSFPGPNVPNYVQGNRIVNNFLGTDITGTQRLSNYTGLFMNGYVDSNFVRNNLISGNMNHGIWTRRSPNAPSRNTFQANKIGTQADGITLLPNDSTGVMIDSAAVNLFGGPNEADANIIAFSNQAGIAVKAGWGFAIQRNAIFKNKGLAIDLGNDGPSPNDSSDADLGPNRLQNYPRITWIGRSGGSTIVKGYLQSRVNTTFRLEFYTNDEADTTGFGEGQTFQKTVDVVTDSSGRAPFEVLIDGAFARVVGTATDPEYGTSEFSKAPFVVNSVADRSDAFPFDGLASTSGPQVNGFPEVTLRSAIQASNQTMGEDDIAFDIPGTPPFFIQPASPLPVMTGNTSVDGTTQPGYSSAAVHAIQILGANAGTDADGLRASGDRTTLRALYITGFKGNGIKNTGERLTLADLTANGNKGCGVRSNGDLTLEGATVFNGNGPGSAKSSPCGTTNIAGIWVAGWLRGSGTVTASSNCGVGIRHDDDGPLSDVEVHLDASVTANGNGAGGFFGSANVQLRGEMFDFSNNGTPTSDGSGMYLGGGRLTIEATGTGELPVIRMNNNSAHGLYTANGSVTLTGRSQFNNNGAGRTRLEKFNNTYSGIAAEGTVKAQSLEASGNGSMGIRSHGSILIDGNLTVKNHPERGVWATFNIDLDGESHRIEENGDQAMWAANGWITVKGTLTVRNNTYGGRLSIDDAPFEPDGLIGSVQAWKDIVLDDVVIENNQPSGIAGWDNVWIKGNATVMNNAVCGIFAMDRLRIDGGENAINGNGANGLVANNREVILNGRTSVDANGHGPAASEENDGYGIIAQFVRTADVTARGNTKTGILGFSGVSVQGSGVVLNNGVHGLSSQSFVSIAGGRISGNQGYGISAPVVRVSGTQISKNGKGGIAGKVEPATTTVKSVPTVNGFSLPPYRSIIRGGAIVNNGGDGIVVDAPFPFSVEGSNISGNTGFAVKNSSGASVVANGNWWGNASGPGTSLSGAVIASDWQSSSVGLFAGIADDTLFVLPSTVDSLSVVAARWSDPGDSVSFTYSDGKGWVTAAANAAVVRKDSVPSVLTLSYSIPPGAIPGDTSHLIIHAASLSAPSVSARDTVVMVVYSPVLSTVSIFADTFRVMSEDTLIVTIWGFDQKGNSVPVTPVWSAGGGTFISPDRFVAGPISGTYAIVCHDSISGKKDSASVIVMAPSGPPPAPVLLLTAAAVNAGNAMPGDTVTTFIGLVNGSFSVLSIDSVRTRTPFFSAVRMPDVPLVPSGDTLSVLVSFMPDSIRTFTDTLFIYYNAPLSPKKVMMNGNGSVTGTDAISASVLPKEFTLDQNYPNPFNPSTTIRFGVPVASRVSVRIYDVLGREIFRLADGMYQPGYFSVVWSAQAASGLYFYRIESSAIHDPTKSFVETKKMLLIR